MTAIVLAAVITAGCDRRREQPIEPSDTAQTSAPAADGAQPAVVEPTDQQTTTAPAPDPCAGLMDDALQDCRSQNIEASRNAAESDEEKVTTP
jgi:hypothetical protein